MGINDSGPGKTPANERAKLQAMVDERRARVASYKVRGFSLREIRLKLAEDGHVNPKKESPWSIGILSKDVKTLEERWRTEALADITVHQARELEKLDQLEREAWSAWHRGIGTKKKTVTEKGTGGQGTRARASVVTEELNGDPRYLAIIVDCQQRRARMLGLDAPLRSEHTGKDGKPMQVESTADLGSLTDGELEQMKTILAGAAARRAGPGSNETPEPT